jgi:DNA-binding MarR family transcriptional regulator
VARADDARAAWHCISQVFWSNEVHDRFHEAVEAIGLPHPGSLKLLNQLEPHEPLPMRRIAELMHCDASYVTALVDTLEAPGYVVRRTAPHDRRVKLVQLTGEGIVARDKAQDILLVPPAAFARLDAGETRTLAKLLAKLTEDG